MLGDKAHAQLLIAGWRWQDAASYHRDVAGLSLSLEPQAYTREDAPTEERLLKLRKGRWLLSRGGTPLAAFDSLPAAATAVVVASAHAP